MGEQSQSAGQTVTLGERMAAAARQLQDQQDPAATMKSAVDLVAHNLHGADGVGLSLISRRRIDTPAFSDDFVAICDRLQNELGEGPCHDAILEHRVVHSPDLGLDDRWPTWGPRVVAEAGIRSMLCFRLFTQSDTVGGLNVYGRSPHNFDDEQTREEGLALAAHIAVAVAGALKIGQLRTALDSRTVIGQAVGIVMERYGLDGDRAFAVLARLSQHTNRKLSDLATELVTTRRLRALDGE